MFSRAGATRTHWHAMPTSFEEAQSAARHRSGISPCGVCARLSAMRFATAEHPFMTMAGWFSWEAQVAITWRWHVPCCRVRRHWDRIVEIEAVGDRETSICRSRAITIFWPIISWSTILTRRASPCWSTPPRGSSATNPPPFARRSSTVSRWAFTHRRNWCAMRARTASRCGRSRSRPATGIARSSGATMAGRRCAWVCEW